MQAVQLGFCTSRILFRSRILYNQEFNLIDVKFNQKFNLIDVKFNQEFNLITVKNVKDLKNSSFFIKTY